MLGGALLLAFLLSCGCATRSHLSFRGQVPTHTGFMQDVTAGGGGNDIEVVRVQYGPTWEWQHDGWCMDVGVHPGATFVVDGQDGGPGIGASVMLRPRLQLDGVEPYVRLEAGMEWHHDNIEGQGTAWGFPLSGGVGFRVPLDHVGWLAFDFNLWHFSNGTKVFGHSLGPNPGVNTDLFGFALEIPFGSEKDVAPSPSP